MAVIIAYCWASGEIEFAADPEWLADVPDGSIAFARGEEADLKRRISDRARHGYEPDAFLVPGLPEFGHQSGSMGDRVDTDRLDTLLHWVERAFSDWPADYENVRTQPGIQMEEDHA